jgi:hypothetical protein
MIEATVKWNSTNLRRAAMRLAERIRRHAEAHRFKRYSQGAHAMPRLLA